MGDINSRPKLYQNMGIIITEEIREEILNGNINPGEKLSHQALMDKYQSSLVQVRSALRSLEIEGLVIINPEGEAFVSELSAEKVRQIFETRIILELGAIELSVPKLNDKDIKKAYEYIEVLDNAKTGRDLSSYNTELHNLLYKRCNNEYLLKMIDRLHHFVERYMRIYLSEHEHNELSQEYHKKIVAAAENCDVEKAKAYLKEHMKLAMDQLMEALGEKD